MFMYILSVEGYGEIHPNPPLFPRLHGQTFAQAETEAEVEAERLRLKLRLELWLMLRLRLD